MNHWSECIYILHVASFGHSFIKEYIWQKPSERFRPNGPLVLGICSENKIKFCQILSIARKELETFIT